MPIGPTGGVGVVRVLLLAIVALALLIGLIIVVSKASRGVMALVIVASFVIGLAVLFLCVGVSYEYMDHASLAHPPQLVEAPLLPKLPPMQDVPAVPPIEMGDSPAAEVDEEWSDTCSEESEISHDEINLSTIPEGHPEWVDQTEGAWDSEKKIWATTVMIGPYETKDECEEHVRKHVGEAVAEFAQWRAGRLSKVDAYAAKDLPQPNVSLHDNHGSSSHNGDEVFELRTFTHGPVVQSYHTTANTAVSDEPWPVVFARIEFDSDFERKVDRVLRHGFSVHRAVRAGTFWGVALLGMILALGGLKMTESSSRAEVLETLSVAPVSEPIGFPPSNRGYAGKRLGLITAPLICTAIYFMTHHGPAPSLHEFWPKWVWFGCALGFLSTWKPFSDH